MNSWKQQIQVQKEPNMLLEALILLQEWTVWKGAVSAGETDLPFREVQILSELELDAGSQERLLERYQDIIDFQTECRIKGEPVLNKAEPLLPLLSLKPKESADEYGFLFLTLGRTDALTAGDLTYEEMLKNMLKLLLHSSDLDEEKAADQRFFALPDAVDRGELPLGEILNLLSRSYYDDGAQLQILRLFQSPEEWFGLIQTVLAELEEIIREAWPTVAGRFEAKVRSLADEENLRNELKVADQLLGELEGQRQGDPILLWISVIGHRVLEIRLPRDRDLHLRIISGILLQELDEFKDRQRSREARLQLQLKAMADPTRFKVIQQLALRPQFVLELANTLELTSATLSHHLSVLQMAFLVRTSIEGRRAYFSLNGEELKDLSDYILSLSQSQGTREI